MIASESMLFTIALSAFVTGFLGQAVSVGASSIRCYRFARGAAWIGALAATLALLIRWANSGNPPMTNTYESMMTLSTFIVWVALVFTWSSPLALVEGASTVMAIMIIGVGSLFSGEIRPLLPVLDSYWLPLHVSLAFLGQAFFAIAFAIGYLYCLKQLLQPSARATEPSLTLTEHRISSAIVLGLPIAFLVGMGALARHFARTPGVEGKWQSVVGLIFAPTALCTLAIFLCLTVFRRQAERLAERHLPTGDRLDEFIYRAIAMGFPLYTVGALLFGMIWAHKAWGRYWGWDPKETWTLVTILVYAMYLHLRLTKGWRGTWMAFLAVIGWLVTMFTMFGVNHLLSGLHSYGAR